MHITGGSYFEFCLTPQWDELFGSGGRAACAVSDANTILTTYIGLDGQDALENLAVTYGFGLQSQQIERTLKFHYDHPLSEPRIFPPFFQHVMPLQVQDEKVLSFGFLEGGAVVDGGMVVYDPQNTYLPTHFTQNGSKAESLAIVANAGQCFEMCGGADDEEAAAKILLEKDSASVVVVKRGALGALVVTKETTTAIPAYRTQTVWKIGTGDIFAAVFAKYWFENPSDPAAAAKLASGATALYCKNRTFPQLADLQTNMAELSVVENISGFPVTQSKKVYLAGPFFTLPQLWLVSEARRALQDAGFQVFSPLHDVGTGTAEEVAPEDLIGLDECDVIFAICDGLDSGTVFEIGYAVSRQKPVVCFVQNESEENLKMLAGTGCMLVPDFTTAVYETVWRAMQE
jgi:nucleoside 2-deoxyribosyltransferase